MKSLDASPSWRSGLPPVLIRFALLLGLLAVVCGASRWIAIHQLHLGEPYNRVLLPSPDVDFMGFLGLYKRLHQYAFFADKTWPIYRYPAPVFLIYAAFFPLPHFRDAFRLATGLLFAGGALLLIRAMRAHGVPLMNAIGFVAVSAAFSYPLYFQYRQANTEPFILLIIASAVWCMLRGHDRTAAALLGVAGSMKIYPFMFLGLYLVRRRWGPVMLAAGVAVVVTIASLRFLTPSILFSWHGVGDGLADYNREFEHFIPITFGYDHSLFTLVKAAARALPLLDRHIHLLKNIYLAVIGVTGTALFFTVIRKLPFVNQLFCLVLAETFLPPSTYDYTLSHLFLPTAMLVLVAVDQRDRFVPGLNAMFVCLALLLGFETELIFRQQRFGGCVKALVFVVLFGLVMRYPLHGTWPEDPLAITEAT